MIYHLNEWVTDDSRGERKSKERPRVKKEFIMKRFRAVVNHSGICEEQFYKAGVATVLTESAIKALGDSVKVLGEYTEGETDTSNVEDKNIKKPFFDRMVHGNETVTK